MTINFSISTNNINEAFKILSILSNETIGTFTNKSYSVPTNSKIDHKDLPDTGVEHKKPYPPAPSKVTKINIDATYSGAFPPILPEVTNIDIAQDCNDLSTVGFGDQLVTSSTQSTVTQSTSKSSVLNQIHLDSAGVPYDVRIHSSPVKRNNDGTWRKKKNVDPEEFEKITQELKNVVAIQPTTPISTSVSETTTLPPSNLAFTNMMLELSKLIGSKLTHEDIELFARTIGCVSNGKGQVAMLQHNPALIPQFMSLVHNHMAVK